MTSRFRAAALAVAFAALASPAQAATSGGTAPSEPPAVESVSCRSACAAIDRARSGSVVRVLGQRLEAAKYVVFLGRRGRRDDVAAAVPAPAAGAIHVQVPRKARSGPIRIISMEGQRSRASRQRLRIGRRTPKRTPRVQARADTRRVFVGAARKPSMSYFVGGTGPATVVVALVPAGQDQPVATWSPGFVAPGTVGSVEWDGLVGGAPAPPGVYEFRVAASPQEQGASAAQAQPRSARTRFRLVSHRFPVAGRHSYGESAARFGAGRESHRHQGQDVFAACGTPLVAAIGGTVKHVAFHERAGHYLVITGDDGYDHVYMHLARRTTVAKGARVSTGDRIGAVGDTGRASGCHLHFELWAAPGWYTGGEPVDPLPFLRSWDA